MSAHPTPWRIEGETIRDRDGGVVVSAINPCGMSTRRLIVDAVNEHYELKQRLQGVMNVVNSFYRDMKHLLEASK